jgi:hypothetical protein
MQFLFLVVMAVQGLHLLYQEQSRLMLVVEVAVVMHQLAQL